MITDIKIEIDSLGGISRKFMIDFDQLAGFVPEARDSSSISHLLFLLRDASSTRNPLLDLRNRDPICAEKDRPKEERESARKEITVKI